MCAWSGAGCRCLCDIGCLGRGTGSPLPPCPEAEGLWWEVARKWAGSPGVKVSQKAKRVYKPGTFEHEECPKSEVRDEKVMGEARHRGRWPDGAHRWAGCWGVRSEGTRLPSGLGEKGTTPAHWAEIFFLFPYSKRKKAINCGSPWSAICKVLIFPPQALPVTQPQLREWQGPVVAQPLSKLPQNPACCVCSPVHRWDPGAGADPLLSSPSLCRTPRTCQRPSPAEMLLVFPSWPVVPCWGSTSSLK